MFSKAQQSLVQASQFLLQAASELSNISTAKHGGRKPGPQSSVQAAQAAVATAATIVEAAAPRAKALKGSAVPVSVPPKRMGRPPKAAAAQAVVVEQPKPPKAVKVVAAAKPVKAAKGAKAAKAAEDTTKIPTLTERLKLVIGDDEVGIDEAIKRLKARGKKWIPNSKGLKAYISLSLSTHQADFSRVSRGVYRVNKTKGKKTGDVASEKSEPAPAAVVEKVETKMEKAEKPEKAERKSKKHSNGAATDDLGLGNVVENPFAPS